MFQTFSCQKMKCEAEVQLTSICEVSDLPLYHCTSINIVWIDSTSSSLYLLIYLESHTVITEK